MSLVVLGCGSEPTGRRDAHAPQPDGGVEDVDVDVDVARASEGPFFADLVADINGRQKRFKYTFTHPASDDQGMTVEFSTGFRDLGSEAVPGEKYSELWLSFGVVGSREMPGAGTYHCRPKAESAAAETRWARLIWSFNHGSGGNARDFHTDGEAGSCTITIASFDPVNPKCQKGHAPGGEGGTYSDHAFNNVPGHRKACQQKSTP